MAQSQTGKLRHQVQLRRPGISNLDWKESRLIIDEHNVLALHSLPYRIVPRYLKTGAVGGDRCRPYILPLAEQRIFWELLEVWL